MHGHCLFVVPAYLPVDGCSMQAPTCHGAAEPVLYNSVPDLQIVDSPICRFPVIAELLSPNLEGIL